MDPNMPKKPLDEWEEIHAKFYSKYKRLGEWQDENFGLVCRQGWYQSFTGRRYTFHKENGIYSKPAVCNYIVQGTATGDIIPLAMMVLRKAIRDKEYDANIICQVHDSIVLDVHKDFVDVVSEELWKTFNNLPTLISKYWGFNWTVPMTGEVEVGHTYKDLEKTWGKQGKL